MPVLQIRAQVRLLTGVKKAGPKHQFFQLTAPRWGEGAGLGQIPLPLWPRFPLLSHEPFNPLGLQGPSSVQLTMPSQPSCPFPPGSVGRANLHWPPSGPPGGNWCSGLISPSCHSSRTTLPIPLCPSSARENSQGCDSKGKLQSSLPGGAGQAWKGPAEPADTSTNASEQYY